MTSHKPLPPIPEDSLDGVKEAHQVTFRRCNHKNVEFRNGLLRCPCGAAWQGPDLHTLYKLLRSQS